MISAHRSAGGVQIQMQTYENDKYGFEVIVTFEEKAGGTLLTMKSIFSSSEIIDELNRMVNAIEGGKQTLNRLEDYVSSQLKNTTA